jgi:hypothetical protein
MSLAIITSVADQDPGLNTWPYFNYFGVCKGHKYFGILCFLTCWVRLYF